MAGGLARRLEADSYVVRVAFVVLSLAGGAGVVLYALAWLLSEPSQDEAAAVVRPGALAGGGLCDRGPARGPEDLGLWPGDAVMVPAIVVAAGSALVWHDPRGSTGVRGPADPFERLMSGRLSAPGSSVVSSSSPRASPLPPTGTCPPCPGRSPRSHLRWPVVLVVGPYAGRLLSEVRSAERERIRTEERAEMAHLHDSALQTLALMQRSADDPGG